MKIVNAHLAHSIREQDMLKSANPFGYIHLAAEVERPRLFFANSLVKKVLLLELKVLCKTLNASTSLVQRVDVFDAIIIPPGTQEGRKLIKKEAYNVHVAAFDIVVLVECTSVENALLIKGRCEFQEIEKLLTEVSTYSYSIVAKNPKRIDEVSKETKGIFLFNYFYSEDTQTLLDVWEYTAGWWTQKANLTNSTPLQPIENNSQYSLINHCRWNRLIDVLPSLLFKTSMKKFVLKNFSANKIVAMPVLYKLA